MTLLNAYGRPATPAATPTVTVTPTGRVLSYGPVVTPAPAPAPAAKAGRAPAYPAAYIITVNVPNPKTGKSAARYALYGPVGATTTVAAYLAAGGRRADIAWDVARGFITVTPAG